MKDCFIICPLGDESSDTRKRSDKMLKYVFKPVLESKEINSIRSDQVPKVGIITTQIIKLIIDCDLVIADLTDSNPNVFYELAIRHSFRKPYIQIITKGQKIPFDLSAIRTIEVDLQDLDSVELAKKELEKQISEFEKGHIADSPISIASSAQLVQNDSDLADEIAERLSYINSYKSDYYYGDTDLLEEISQKLYGFNKFSFISIEDLNSKLEKILNKLNSLEDKSKKIP
jgi:hypothetical protein